MKALILISALIFSTQTWACDENHAAAATGEHATGGRLVASNGTAGLGGVSTKATATAAATTATDGLTQNLTVAGMTCGGCEQSIESQVLKVPGVKSVKADHTTGTVAVETDGKIPVDHAALTAAVKKAGKQYTVKN